MNVILNGEATDITEQNLEELCKRFLDHPHYVATAVNGEFVAVKEREKFVLSEGDKIEVLSPRQGG